MTTTAAVPRNFLLQSFEVGILLPSQFFEYMKSDPFAQPEKRLMLAVVDDAIKTFHRCLPGATRRQRRLLREVEEWFASPEVVWPFSFQNICAVLNLDADYLRSGLAHWKARRRAQPSGSTPPPSPSLRRATGRRHTLSAQERPRSRLRRRRAA